MHLEDVLNRECIRQTLRNKCMTQLELARLVKTSPQHINAIMVGRKAPSIAMLRRIATVLNLSADALLSCPTIAVHIPAGQTHER